MDFNLYFYLSKLVLFSLLLSIPAAPVPVSSLKFLSSLGHSVVWSTGQLHPPQICANGPCFFIHIYVVSLGISLKVDHIWELVLRSRSTSQSSYTLTIKKERKKLIFLLKMSKMKRNTKSPWGGRSGEVCIIRKEKVCL